MTEAVERGDARGIIVARTRTGKLGPKQIVWLDEKIVNFKKHREAIEKMIADTMDSRERTGRHKDSLTTSA